MPIYGWNSAGGTEAGSASQFTYSNVTDTNTAGAGETLDNVFAYLRTTTGTDTVDVGLYTFDGTWPDVVTAQGTSGTITTTDAWVSASFAIALSNGTEYCAALENNGTSIIRYHYNSGSTMAYEAGVFPDPWTATTSLGRRLSVYGESSAGVTTGDLDINSSGVVAMSGESQVDSPVSIVSAAVVTMSGEAQADGDMDVSASATVTWVGEATATTDADLSISATATVTMEGESDASGNANIDASGNIIMEGVSAVDNPFQIDASGLATFSSEEEVVEVPEVVPLIEGGGGGWPSKEHYRQKRKKEERKLQEQEILELIALAIPGIIQHINR